MSERRIGCDPSDVCDAEPGYVHSVAPDARRLEPLDNPRIMEEGCFEISDEKKYYKFENKEGPVYIKRNLTPSEYAYNDAGELVIPYLCLERMANEVAAIRYSKPEDDSELSEAIAPYRVATAIAQQQAIKFRKSAVPEFVLCHNDLSQDNVIVDETTLKVNAILDWEYAGFYPPEFDSPFYLRPGPSVAIQEEEDDVPKLLEVLEHWKAE
ncbi:hypothetical protein M413DRAFT_419347 [Hebeloma cylindrosporum]|uniref:Aminoglycoside phosphotransferase domain-containing protein n=1 Tax=Hebeloma cylindrosporum TaxID=76867 RepID=A0A0C3BQQ0_HEBCY|nr:hypothetical protein M413DRAFT_419347 [Hebeloma cylindrosporum h7]